MPAEPNSRLRSAGEVLLREGLGGVQNAKRLWQAGTGSRRRSREWKTGRNQSGDGGEWVGAATEQ